jgi:uncharacterized protein (DUF2236 family)
MESMRPAIARLGDLRPGLYADDSVTRRVNRENILLLGGGRALLMQLAHPSVAAGVDEHSDFRSAPLRRLRRTIRTTMAIVFGDQETAMAAARAVNKVHARVRGATYNALDPDLLLWVHATLADTSLATYETLVKPLSPDERDDFHQEFKRFGELLGIPHERFPDSYADFEAYMDEMMSSSGPVRVDERARALAQHVLRPKLHLLPGAAMVPFEIVTAGLLPSTLRDQYGLPWGAAQRRAYRIAVQGLRRVVAVTPPVLRVWPLPGHNVTLTSA